MKLKCVGQILNISIMKNKTLLLEKIQLYFAIVDDASLINSFLTEYYENNNRINEGPISLKYDMLTWNKCFAAYFRPIGTSCLQFFK